MNDHALTPVMAEQRLLALDTAMTQAELHLRRARDAEVTAKHVYEAARRRASFDRECPHVERGGATVDMRKQWIEDRCADEGRDYDIKTAAREAAQDHHRTVRDQAMICMALLRSVTTAYAMSGATP